MIKPMLWGGSSWILGFLLAFSTAWANGPANDTCAGAVVIPRLGPFPYLTPMVDATGATLSVGDPPLIDFLSNGVVYSVWYKFTPAATAIYTISTCVDMGTATTIIDTVLGVYTS